MDAWDVILSRRDVREFEPRPIADDDLDRILEAGRRSPSSQNWQPWTFVVVTGKAALGRLSGVWKGASHVRSSAATIALVAEPPGSAAGDERLHYDLGQATMSMMFAAAALGIGSGHSAVEDQDLARSVLRLGPEQRCYYLVVLGHPAQPLRPVRHPDRRPFDEVVRRVS
jgi:nitroreductase